MKKLLLALFLSATALLAQNPRPQPTYAQTMSLRKPSTWLRLNGSSTTSFLDSASTKTFFSANGIVTGGLTPGSQGASGFAVVNVANPLAAGVIQSIAMQMFTPPSAPQTMTFFIASGTAPNFTIVDSWTVTIPAFQKYIVFTAGVDWTGTHTATAGQFIGTWASTTPSTNVVAANGPGGSAYFLAASSALPSGSNTYAHTGASQIVTVFQSTGTGVNVQQPGFDLTQENNFSVGLPATTSIFAPDTTTGDYEWNVPHSYYIHIDNVMLSRLNGGTVTLMAKGNYLWGNGWAIDLEPDTADGFPLAYKVCYQERGTTTIGPGTISQTLCTGNGVNAIGNGVGYDILFTDGGTGSIFDDNLYINGVNGGGLGTGPAYISNFGFGFGFIDPAVTGGTGYANTTPVTVTGGGCHVVNMVMHSSGGVPSNFTWDKNAGCTSTPSCTVSGTGTGASISCPFALSTLSTSTTFPLTIGSPFYGIASDSTQGNFLVDEAAAFSSALTPVDAVNLFYQTNWYQQIVGAAPSNPPLVIFDDDGGDPDNEYALATAIGADLHGYIKLIGLVFDEASGQCPTLWRQMLDQAGLNHIPIGVSHSFPAGGPNCTPTNLVIYNASTPQASTAFVSSTVLYRTLLAKYSTTAVHLYTSGDWSAMAPFMQSPADSISPLTGLQLIAQDATNGGAIYMQGLTACLPTSPPVPRPCTGSASGADTNNFFTNLQYVVSHNGSLPIYWIQGTPLANGNDLTSSRTSKDPMFLFSSVNGPRNGWDTLTLLPIFTRKFTDGMVVTVSGGTGYANETALTQTGGGPECPAQLGWLPASSGVPTGGNQFIGGGDANTSYFGIYTGMGQGCTSLPTVSASGTGSGVTLTPHLTTFCGTINVAVASGTGTITLSDGTCSNHFFMNMSAISAESPEPAEFQWFTNSLMDNPPVGQPRLPN